MNIRQAIGQFFSRRSTIGTVLLGHGNGYTSYTGKNLSELSALRSGAVFACAKILSESIGSLPLILYQRLDRGKKRATQHSLYNLLHDLPNPELTSIEQREILQGHLSLWGNAYAEIVYNGAGRVAEIWPLRPDRTAATRYRGQLIYVVEIGQDNDREPERHVLPGNRVMHLRSFGYNGVHGFSPISLARQAIGLSLATEEYGARFFGNGAKPPAVIEHPGVLEKRAQERLRDTWQAAHGGLSNAHRVAVLEEGMTLREIGIPPEDAQFLETRKFQVAEIARVFRIPPHMLADLERATFSNIEHLGLEFVTHTLRPWLVRWEQAIKRDLLTPTERRTFFAEHLVDGLLRGDIKSRYEAYTQGRQNGWLSANDIRELENQNPVEGGDIYLVPLNMVPANSVTDAPASESGRQARGLLPESRAKQVGASRRRLANTWQRVLSDTMTRVIRRESSDIKRAARKYFNSRTASEFKLWLIEFYDDLKPYIVKQFLPVLISYSEQIGASVEQEVGSDPGDMRAFIDSYVDSLAARHVGAQLGELQDMLESSLDEGEDPIEAIDARMEHWEDIKPDFIGQRESIQALGALTVAMYSRVGVRKKQWVASGDSCPYCRDLDGKTVGVEEYFLDQDSEFQPEGAERPLKRTHDIGHAPAHDGCDCTIVSA